MLGQTMLPALLPCHHFTGGEEGGTLKTTGAPCWVNTCPGQRIQQALVGQAWWELAVLVHAYGLSTQEAEAEGSQVQSQRGLYSNLKGSQTAQ